MVRACPSPARMPSLISRRIALCISADRFHPGVRRYEASPITDGLVRLCITPSGDNPLGACLRSESFGPCVRPPPPPPPPRPNAAACYAKCAESTCASMAMRFTCDELAAPPLECDCTGCCPRTRDALLMHSGGVCDDSCTMHKADGECDDGGESSEYTECTLGTDCTDCGVRLLPPPPPPPVDHAKPSRLPEHVERPWWMEFIGRTFFVRGLTPIG